MATLTKRATIYFDPDIHRVLKIKAASTNKSISEIVDTAIRQELTQDEEDLRIFEERVHEPSISFEEILKELKVNGKI
ncbi:MAG: CopG family transcriptional regulator [Candidatus Marinimicrobia bacterium]|nr:CopG family transcriptional regulator [Bacteroidota bacterium]MBU4444994.1 CopG family transcriptional regulator [bacterium]MCG2715806.1 CopG family transcriptional regulator [Candidatus Neomarinimicrobiota bacterium]